MTEKIRFSDLVEHISFEAGVPRQFAHDYLKELSAVIEEGLVRDGTVSIYGFGNFKLQWAEPRRGVNPRTGAPMDIPGRHRVIFRPHKRLRDFINRRYRNLAVEVLDSRRADAAPSQGGRSRAGASAARASAAEAIGGAHTIAERVALPPELAPQAPEAPGDASGVEAHGEPLAEWSGFGASVEEQAGSSVAAARHGWRAGKFVWLGIAAGVLVLLLAVLTLLQRGPATPPPGRVAARAVDSVGYTEQRAPPGAEIGAQPARKAAERSGASPRGAAAAPPLQNVKPAAPAPTRAAMQADGDAAPGGGATRALSGAGATRAVSGASASQTGTGTPGGSHRARKGDSYWAIASERYQDGYLWPHIYRANDQGVANPDVLRSGSLVRVPPLQGTARALTAQDRRDVALGYLRAYMAYKRLGKVKAAYYLWVAELRDPQVLREHAADIDPKDLEFINTLHK